MARTKNPSFQFGFAGAGHLLEPLEGLDADDVAADDLHGLDDLVVLEFSHGAGALLLRLLGSLDRDKFVAILGHNTSDLST